MTKRSHEIASRQAEIARERKRKKKLQILRPASSGAATPGESEAGAANLSSETSRSGTSFTSAQPVQSMTAEEMQSRYVKRDLKLIAFITIPIVIVLIVLAIVL